MPSGLPWSSYMDKALSVTPLRRSGEGIESFYCGIGGVLCKCVQWISGLCASCLSVSGTHDGSMTCSFHCILKGLSSTGFTPLAEWSR